MTEAAQRLAVVAEARTWLRTPWHHNAGLKGVGVDCATLLARVYGNAGVIPPVDTGKYAQQWHLHRRIELFLERVRQYAREIPGPPQQGDLVMFHSGHVHSHGAIVTAWPEIIHAHLRHGVVLADAEKDHELAFKHGDDRCIVEPRERLFFSPWGAV